MSELIEIQLFAGPSDEVGAPRVQLGLARLPCTVEEVVGELVRVYPSLGRYRSILLVSVNQRHAANRDLVRTGDEVAVFSPVMGG